MTDTETELIAINAGDITYFVRPDQVGRYTRLVDNEPEGMMDTTILNPGNGIDEEYEEYDPRLRIEDLEDENAELRRQMEDLQQVNGELRVSLEQSDAELADYEGEFSVKGLVAAANTIIDAERFRVRMLGFKPLSPIHGLLTLEVDATAGDALGFHYDDEWTLSGAVMQDFAALDQEV